MYFFNSRVSRVAPVLTLVAALAACVDETTPTDPIRQLKPQFGVGDVITVANTSGGTDIGSLRWAMSHVTGGEVIHFDPSLAGQTIVLDSTLMTFERVTIEGPAGGITISGGGKGRVLDFNGTAIDTAVLRNLTITGGKELYGAGVESHPVLIIENSTFTGNEADTRPAIDGNNTVTLINTTVSGNTVTGSIISQSVVFGTPLRLVNSTVAHNAGGGAIGANLFLRNSVISNNASGKNCTFVTIVREGTNLSDDDTCGAPFEIIIADAQLGPLADNGRSTRTHALLAGSPAINAGTNCTIGVDQRYVVRDAQCDLGAFEFIDFTTVDLTMAASATIDKTNGWAVLTGTVRCSRNESFDLHVELHQMQKQSQSTVDVHAAATTPIACSTSVQPWSIALVTTDDPFQTGSSAATAGTLNAEPWVTPASLSQSVKLFNGRK